MIRVDHADVGAAFQNGGRFFQGRGFEQIVAVENPDVASTGFGAGPDNEWACPIRSPPKSRKRESSPAMSRAISSELSVEPSSQRIASPIGQGLQLQASQSLFQKPGPVVVRGDNGHKRLHVVSFRY